MAKATKFIRRNGRVIPIKIDVPGTKTEMISDDIYEPKADPEVLAKFRVRLRGPLPKNPALRTSAETLAHQDALEKATRLRAMKKKLGRHS
jgi:hypothetical protein